MGLKLKWFRHRLTFDSLPTDPSTTSSTPVLGRFRRSRSEAVLVTGYYRRSVDEDVVERNHQAPLPPIKTRKRSNQWITPQMTPAPSMPSLSETSPELFKKVEQKAPEVPKVEEKKTEIPNYPPPSYSKEDTNKIPTRTSGDSADDNAAIRTTAINGVVPLNKRPEGSPKPVSVGEAIGGTATVDKIENKDEDVPKLPPRDHKRKPTSQVVVSKVIEVQKPVSLVEAKDQNENKEEDLPKPSPRDHERKPTSPPLVSKVIEAQKTPESPAKSPNESRNPIAAQRPKSLPVTVKEDQYEDVSFDTPPPLPTSAPPQEDPLPWFEIDEDVVDHSIRKADLKPKSKKKSAPVPPARTSKATDELPVISTPEPRLTPPAYEDIKPPVEKEISNKVQQPPKVIKIGDTIPPAVQKPSKFRALFGLSSPVSPEPPKPKTRRIRVPKQKSPKSAPKPLPRTVSLEKAKPKEPEISTQPTSPKEEIRKPEPPKNPMAQSYDTPLTFVTSNGVSANEIPIPPVRKTKAANGAKQLSFAENAMIYSDEESKEDQLDDQDNMWDLVAKHRANVNQSANLMRTARPLTSEKKIDLVPLDRPKTMRDMRKSQSVGAGVNLKNKALATDSDTEA